MLEFLTDFFALSFFVTFFGFFIWNTVLFDRRKKIMKKLASIDYEYYSDHLPDRFLFLSWQAGRRMARFFRMNTWPGNIPKDIQKDLQENRKFEYVVLVFNWGPPIFYILTLIFMSIPRTPPLAG